MANIRVTADQALYTGMQITFKAPCDSTGFDNLVVDYPNADGTTGTGTFTVCDAQGAAVTGTHSFCSNSLITVTLCLDSKKAYLMNHAGSANCIVEQGTSGVWTYRKWADGTRECWGRVSKTISMTSTTSGLVVYTTGIRGTFPSGLFTEAPVCQATLNKIISSDGETHYNAWTYVKDPSTTTRTVGVGLLRLGSEISNVTAEVGFYAIGK